MLRPFVPSQNHEQSKLFYGALGFETKHADGQIAIMSNGVDSFILQNFYVRELAENLMLQLSVPDVNAWWNEYDPAGIAERFGAKSPTLPSLQPWGMVVGFVYDPCGVLWHVNEAKA